MPSHDVGAGPGKLELLARLQCFTFQYATASRPALYEVDLELRQGQLTLISGLSGSGKSTLARMLAGFIPHHLEGSVEGTATVLGHDVATSSPSELSQHVGIVFDNPFDQLTGATRNVFDEVAYALENEGLPRREIIDRVRSALDQVQLVDLFGRHPRELSGGQSQRLAIASALAQQKPVLVLDDPTSQLDPAGAREIVEVIARLREEGTTIVVVAQDVRSWVRLASHLIVIVDGRVQASGSPTSLLSHPEHLDGSITLPAFITLWHELQRRGLDVGETPPLELELLIDRLRPFRDAMRARP